MCISIWQVPRFRINSGWLKINSTLDLRHVRASAVNGKNKWIRRNLSTTTQSSLSKIKNNVLGGAIPVTRIIDSENIAKIQQPFGNLQQRISEDKDLSNLLTVIVTDLETTGFHRAKERIIEIAAQDLAGGENSTFQTLINPGFPILNSCIHGIRNDMVRRPEVPRMEELIPIFLRYIQSREKAGGYVMLVAHNGKSFDFQFLINEFNRCSYEIPHNWLLLDSLPLAKENMKSLGTKVQPKATLQALAEYYDLTRDGQAHRALSDVLLLSQVFQRLTVDLKLSVSDLVLRSQSVSDITTSMAKNKKA